jgi:hypothetical protein
MNQPAHANLCFLTHVDGRTLLNLTVPAGEPVFDANGFARIAINKDHLAGIALEATRQLVEMAGRGK